MVGDPETAVTGFSRAEHQQLDQIIRADIAEAFRSGGDIPLLPSDRSRATEVRPLLAIHIGWARVVDRVEFDMGSSYNSVASAPDLAAVVRSVTRGQVDSFVSLYVRAHAKPA